MRYLFFICATLLQLSALGQTSIDDDLDMRIPLFKNYDFSTGNYSLLIHNEGSKNNSIFDTVGKVYLVQKGMSKYASAIDTAGKNYIDDKATLEQLKKAWRFYPKTFVQDTTCKTHYSVKVCKNKLTLKDYSVNCGQLVFFNSFKDESALFEKKLGEEAFTFNDSTLLAFNGKLKKAFRREYKYNSIEEARLKLAKLVLDTNLLTIEEPLWKKFEGSVVIAYTPAKKQKKQFENKAINASLTELANELQKAYPNELFFLEYQWGSENTLVVEIVCNQTLGEKFTLYPIECCKWETFSPVLVSYWKQ